MPINQRSVTARAVRGCDNIERRSRRAFFHSLSGIGSTIIVAKISRRIDQVAQALLEHLGFGKTTVGLALP
jgi:hypothetical protein